MTRIDNLIKKYDVPVPRYTSYPTVPCWDTKGFSNSQWRSAVERIFDETNATKGVSLYIHLPFCESLCTYCACNTRITRNHSVEGPYMNALLREWELYRYIFGKRPLIRELHLGGGTPTFFSAENLKILIGKIVSGGDLYPGAEFSFEGHPNNTSFDHLKTLFECGFRRVSYGVQDLDPKVQKAINRIQPFENLQNAVKKSREIGYESISFDLIYGLPYQTTNTIIATFRKVLQLKPDRVAFYSYAHVPWLKPGQRGYEDANLPGDVEKRMLYETGRQLLSSEGYTDIGMDHFSLPHDELFKARTQGRLHRNFMGYTTSQTDLLIGLGASAISDAKYAYAQNIKTVEEYEANILQDKLAVFKGHIQTAEDLHIKECILSIACHGKLRNELLMEMQDETLTRKLKTMESEGIVKFAGEGMQVTDVGNAFIRNICNTFDFRQQMLGTSLEKTFSKSI
ncbi:MAG TPA: oxygen-independent coproporphyrinogen III oxidase [Cyclobacteriaceae bacterium]|nr:oxygen-independent coproporphyrinogen III oxidase [Cyclobacteriaceae bacterium]